MTRTIVAAAAGLAALLLASATAAETFTVLPDQTFDVRQPGPRGDIAIWVADPPPQPGFNAIRACARVSAFDEHRLFSPLFSVILIAGDEVLRLRFVNDDRSTTLLPVYIRRDSVESPDTAVTSGSRRKVKKEVRMGPVVELGQPFDLGLSWTPDGVVDVMVKTGGRENHVSVRLKTAPTGVRVVASTGTWRLTPFEFGVTTPDDPNLDPDLRPKAGCDSPAAAHIDESPDPEEEKIEDSPV
ncbi:MAG: hypothetical protein K1X35_04650 [Caulobacteraceae bacterium]|nr:hypothetical protein [Caulobacteraceae bacterium]